MKFPKCLSAVSIFVNNITCGPKGWSICARMWEARLRGNSCAKVACSLTDNLFFFDPQHCRRAWLLRND